MASIKDLKRMCKNMTCKDCQLSDSDAADCWMFTLPDSYPDEDIDAIVDKWVEEHPAAKESAKEFVDKVRKLADEYNVNYFVVTDGYSSISNNGNDAVRNARKAHMKWEKEHGFETEGHPVKTYAMDFLGKFLNAQLYGDKTPIACRENIYGNGCPRRDNTVSDCADCWNQIIPEDK